MKATLPNPIRQFYLMMHRRRQSVLLIFFLLELLFTGCSLMKPFLPALPFNSQPQMLTMKPPAQVLTGVVHGTALVATSQSMEKTLFVQHTNPGAPIFFRDKPNLWAILATTPGLLFLLLGLGEILHYYRVKRRRWAAGVSFWGFHARTGVVWGKQAVRSAKAISRFGWLYLALGIVLFIFGILLTFLR